MEYLHWQKSWVWTSSCGLSVVRVMDDGTDKLIAQLGTRIGMIMEDVVDLALTLGQAAGMKRSQRLDQLEQASRSISGLVQAALVLDRQKRE